ncbi:hypothetical protein [Chryseolinea lacunae]|uniref:Uncharacterized protein n=1 Tax=Chryseolinea lacunae TaxID=2801331 RepID=A0ABS1KUJ4_9BACT|nr:hypothetical protein [Chryseolinea lacunae]MBL0743044.1 hypothetical protein [Chryseolinea lacunae]
MEKSLAKAKPINTNKKMTNPLNIHFFKAVHSCLTIVCFILLFHICAPSNAQDQKTQEKQLTTKFEEFSSKVGSMLKFEDYPLSPLKIKLGGSVETRIRKLSSGGVTMHFYQIQKRAQYSTSSASIEYSDLLEILRSLATLKQASGADQSRNPYYLENKFITTDGFQVGYFVSDGKLSWYIKLEQYGSDNTLFISDPEFLASSFNEAKAKIDDLTKNNR